MKKNFILVLLICILLTFFSTAVFAMNPFITHIYTADPSAHVFENRVYVYPSHDKDIPGFFDMEDYHVFSSADMINWVDHGVVLSYKDVPWVMQPTNPGGPNYEGDNHPSMWAPDCAYKNGTYYLYFPAKDTTGNFRIGVAKNENRSPAGPFTALSNPIPGSSSVDPCVFVDDDGQAYMFFGGQGAGGRDGHGPLWVRLNSDMTGFVGDPEEITSGVDNWFEACWIHKRNGIYYLSYSTGGHTSNTSEIHYSTSNNIADKNSWSYKGCVIHKDNNYITGWTDHQSFVEYKGNWYAFYHTSNMSGGDTQRRSICVNRLYYNTDGTMQQVTPTRDGVGTSAYSRIKAQFYSYMYGIETSQDCGGGDIGKRVSHIDNGDRLGYDLDFGSIGAIKFEASVASNNNGGTIEIWRQRGREDSKIGSVTVSNTGGWGDNAENWTTVSCDLTSATYGEYYITLRFVGGSGGLMNLNWFKFKPSQNIPVGYSVAFKSQNPNCIDDNQNQGQKYLSAHTIDTTSTTYACADRNAVGGAWEKFSIISKDPDDSGLLNNLIQLNSSNNGLNLKLWTPAGSGAGAPRFIFVDGHDYFSLPVPNPSSNMAFNESFNWLPNSDGTISLKNSYNNKYLCVDTSLGNDPAVVYANRDTVGQDSNGISWEKYYAEVADAPIGCIVAFKSQYNQQYLCVDGNNGLDLCANRASVGGAWEKFLVVDAGNGYIALKSLNGNKYLNFWSTDQAGHGDQDIINADGNQKFQWRNNGDGTVSLFSVGQKKYLCVDKTEDTGDNPAKVYANRDVVGQGSDGISWEKFYCQVIQ